MGLDLELEGDEVAMLRQSRSGPAPHSPRPTHHTAAQHRSNGEQSWGEVVYCSTQLEGAVTTLHCAELVTFVAEVH